MKMANPQSATTVFTPPTGDWDVLCNTAWTYPPLTILRIYECTPAYLMYQAVYVAQTLNHSKNSPVPRSHINKKTILFKF
jgi:hypothetical protein